MAVVTFLVLQVSVLLLIVAGGGLFPETVCLAAALTCSVWGIGWVVRARELPPPAAGFSFPWLEASMAVVLLFVILTAIPIPPLLEPFAGGLRGEQNHSVEVALRQAARLGLVDEARPWFTLSRNRAGTLRFLLLLTASFGAMMLSASLPRRGRVAYLYFLALAGAVVAIAGHISQWWIPQGDRLWWMIPIGHVLPGPVGCFVNRNHFGGFVAMMIPLAIVLTGQAFRDRRLAAGGLLLGAVAAMILALVMSLSRGAWIAFAAGCLGMGLRLGYRRRLWPALLSLLAVALVTVLVYAVSPAARERLASFRHPLGAPSVQNRLMEWRESLRVWPAYPVIGPGANALRMVYPQARQTSSGRWLVFSENEYIQLLVEGGWLGLTLAIGWALAVRHRYRSAAETPPEMILLAITGALGVATVHCLFDFPMHLPLYAVVLASLVGLALPIPAPPPRNRWFLALSPVFLGLLASAVLALHPASRLRLLDAEEYLAQAAPADLRDALVSAPTSWHAWYYLGRRSCRQGVDERKLALCFFGEELMSRALALDPQNYRLWYWVGKTRLILRDHEGAQAAFARAQALRPWLTPPPLERRP